MLSFGIELEVHPKIGSLEAVALFKITNDVEESIYNVGPGLPRPRPTCRGNDHDRRKRGHGECRLHCSRTFS